MVIKIFNTIADNTKNKKKKEEVVLKKSNEELLLEEIRDLLKEK